MFIQNSLTKRSITMTIRKATPEETEAFYGSGLVLFGQRPPTSSTKDLKTQEEDDSLSEETEEDGIRAEALRRLKVRRLFKGQPGQTQD